MIDLSKLADRDIGRKVIFTYLHGESCEGVLTSWNDKFVFVRFKGPNGEACDPVQCQFLDLDARLPQCNGRGVVGDGSYQHPIEDCRACRARGFIRQSGVNHE